MLDNTWRMIMGATGRRPPVLSYLTTVVDTSDLTTYQFNGVACGADDSTRKLIVVAIFGASTARSFSSISVAGQTVSPVVSGQGAAENANNHIFVVEYPTGSTFDSSFTFTAAGTTRAALAVYRATGDFTITPDDTISPALSNPVSTSINVGAGGFIVASARVSTSTNNYTWTNLDEDYDATVEINRFSTASTSGIATAGSYAFSVSGNNNTGVCAASWSL